MATTFPAPLRKGDTIGIVCPAGYMPRSKANTCIAVLQQWGFRVKVGKTVGHQHHYFSGTDEERLHDLQHMLDDKEVKAILCGRGGYGTSVIVDRINWKAFKRQPKWIIGYSDITVLHSFLHRQLHTASLHAPMAGAFQEDEGKDVYVQSLRKVLQGKGYRYKAAPHAANRPGKAQGLLLGGNLSLLAHQVGSPSALQTKGAILFLEDIGEYLYNVDRMLLQLDRAGMLAKLAGLVVGGFTDMKDTVIPMGKTLEQIVLDRVAHYHFPVCFGFAVSHEKENYALMHGAMHQLQVGSRGTTLSYKPA